MPAITNTSARPYPKRPYRGADEVAPGDIVRMNHQDNDGNPIEPDGFADAIIADVVGDTVYLARPHVWLDEQSGAVCVRLETFSSHSREHLMAHYQVLTTGWSGSKDHRWYSSRDSKWRSDPNPRLAQVRRESAGNE